MIKVYFQSEVGSHSELVATFTTDELYMKCLNTLEEEAEKQRCVVIEVEVANNEIWGGEI